jgi:hypothetical protein
MAWRDALAHAGLTLGRRTALHIYGVSQVAKYIPGNFLHLLGRQAMGVASGVPAVPLARSMAWELLLLAIAGALFLVPVLPSWLNVLSPGGALTAWIVTTVLAYVLVSRLMSRELGAALLWNTGFLAVSGLVFAALLYRVSPTAVTGSESLLLVVAGYAVAWLAGFVTPGAPAGVGIREWVAWALLQHVAAESEVLAAVIAARMVSVLGDLLFFMFAQLSGPGRPVASR